MVFAPVKQSFLAEKISTGLSKQYQISLKAHLQEIQKLQHLNVDA